MEAQKYNTVGVAGATGNVGRRVLQQLLSQPGVLVPIALSRKPLQEHPNLPRRLIDYEDKSLLEDSFRGLDAIVFPGSDGDPGDVLRHHQNVVAAASKCGVRRFIYLSTQGVSPDSPFCYARVHHATEELLLSSNMEVCILRASIFMEFFISAFLRVALKDGVLQVPVNAGKVSLIKRAQVADALVGAVRRSDSNRVFNLTGSSALSFNDILQHVNDCTGQLLPCEAVGENPYREILMRRGIGPCYVDAFTTMLGHSIPNGDFGCICNDVQELTGAPPLQLEDCLANELDGGV